MGQKTNVPVPNPFQNEGAVQGESVQARPAPGGRVFLARVTDGLVTLSVLVLFAKLIRPSLGISFLPGLSHIVFVALMTGAASFWAGLLLPWTPGHRAWSLESQDHGDRGHHLRWIGQPTLGSLLRGTFTTVFVLFATFLTLDQVLLSSPAMRRADTISVLPFAPAEQDRSWVSLPFFFASGAWPRTFLGQPVFYELPYEKGLPKKFLGRVIARWSAPEVTLTLEGPKTRTDATVAAIYDCLRNPIQSWECLRIRQDTLGVHFEAMGIRQALSWKLQWFDVNNPHLDPQESPRGFMIEATHPGGTSEQRWVLLNALSAQQALVLRYPTGSDGAQAELLLSRTIGSLRVFSDLGPGRGLANERLLETELRALEGEDDPIRYASKVAGIQAVLVSKLSVDPRSFDACYHLAGTALMLFNYSRSLRVRSTQILSGPLALMLQDWSAVSKPLVQSAYQYGMDIGSEPSRIKRLESIWAESRRN